MSMNTLNPPFAHGTQGADGVLNPAFLIAATMNAHGCISVQAVFDGKPAPGTRAEFSLGPSGDVMQRCFNVGDSDIGTQPARNAGYRKEPLDMLFLGECLTYALGPLTPSLFRVTGPVSKGQRRLEETGGLTDRRRLRLLHDAFNLYLLAYEERLI